MPQDSSSDRRFRCRECDRPRLAMVALLPDGLNRRKLMAEPVCVDHHRPGSLEPVDRTNSFLRWYLRGAD